MKQSAPAPARCRTRYLVGLLALLFAAPMLLAWWLQRHPAWLPTGQSQYGRLLHPPPELPDAVLHHAMDGTAARLYGKWTLLQPDGGRCAAACMQMLQQARYVRLISGRHSHHTQQLLLAGGLSGEATRRRLAAQPGLLLYQAPKAAQNALDLLGEKDQGAAGDTLPAAALYLVDPRGQVVLAYTAEASVGAIREDLQRLLRYNRSLE